MGLKKVVIIGGGISGLATLHFLKKRFNNDVDITLYEAASTVGGNIRTLTKSGFVFETGPNGFLDTVPATLELINDLGLSDQLITADHLAKRRYIQLKNKLNLLPMGFVKFISSSILNPIEKLQLFMGMFNKKIIKDQTIYDYVSKRFGHGTASKLADPFMRGIFGGDIRQLHMRYAFPKMKKGTMTTLKEGMGFLCTSLQSKYAVSIIKNHPITSLASIKADYIVSTIPAYQAASLLDKNFLNDIPYCPLSVVGLGFEESDFAKRPDGFGYLIPSKEGKDILGVLIESNVYKDRAPNGMVMLRVMIGKISTEETLIEQAMSELKIIYGLKGKPVVTWVQSWPRAIPQYEMNYPSILQQLGKPKDNIIISGNFLNGISVNECINNAKDIAHSINL